MRKLLIGALGGALLTTAGAASAAIETCAPDGESRAVADAYDARWRSAVAQRDTAALAELYAESAVLMPPSDETLVGRELIAERLGDGELTARAADYSVDVVSCDIQGGALHVAGVWGAATADGWTTGNVMRVLEPAANGRWVSRYEIWN